MVSVILWDFGNTLCDERWMLRPPKQFPRWAEAWRRVMDVYADGWNDGSVEFSAIVAEVARETSLSIAEIDAHVADCCERIEFFPAAWTVVRERRRPQALVTINPSGFEEWVAAPHGLGEVFDAIVVSGVEGTAGKAELCDIALARIGYNGARSNALLIDNSVENVESWRSRGGAAYLFRDDATFANEVDALLPV